MTTPASAPGLVAVVNEQGGCPGCGQGLGRPHYERCQIDPPDYGRFLTHQESAALIAYAIGIFPLDVIRRSTIRAMLPRGRTRPRSRPSGSTGHPSVNTTSAAFIRTLRKLEDHGWIERRDDCVIVRQRARLLSSARRRLAGSADAVAALHGSLAAVAAGLPDEITPAGIAQRNAELRALQRLMEATPATGPHQGRGYVRLASKPRMLP